MSNQVNSIVADGHARVHVGDAYLQQDSHYLADLRTSDPRLDKARIEEASGNRLLQDCYRWILGHEDYVRWRQDTDSRLLWIKGDPGKGKTMLLCGIIDELSPSTRLSYFFCQAADSRINSATAVLRGLVYLLVKQLPSLASHIHDKYKDAGRQLFEDANAWFALSSIFTSILEDAGLMETYIVIDALDECVVDLPRLLKLIVDVTERSSATPKIKWIVSSRNWPDIERYLSAATSKTQLCLELNDGSISTAVNRYIAHRVSVLAELQKYNDKTRTAVEDYLLANSNSTFLWVALVCLGLEKVQRWETLTSLEALPPGLDHLYERMLEQIRRSRYETLLNDILRIMLMVYRPITLEELSSTIDEQKGVLNDDLRDMVSLCGSFLTLKEGSVYFVHQSAKDYLLSIDSVFPQGIKHEHRRIFWKSLNIISPVLRRDMYDLRAPGFPIHQVSQTVSDPLTSIHYACVFWADHLHDSHSFTTVSETRESLKDDGVVHEFLKRKFLYWVEALSLCRSVDKGILALQRVVELAEFAQARELTQLLRDAQRFLLHHRSVIEIAPLQIYSFALVFSPTLSRVRRLFNKEEPDWLISSPSMATHWSACLQTLEGHEGDVTALVFSVDGKQMASGARDTMVKVWDSSTGACIQTLQGHGDKITLIEFLPDEQLASASLDMAIKIWHITSGSCWHTIEGCRNPITSAFFSPDGRQLTISFSDVYERQEYYFKGIDGGWVLSEAGTRHARGALYPSEGRIHIWSAEMDECLHTLDVGSEKPYWLVMSPDDRRLGIALGTRLMVWDFAAGILQTLGDYGSGVQRAASWEDVKTAAFSADGRQLATSDHRVIWVWEVATGKSKVISDDCYATGLMTFSPDGRQLATCTGGRGVNPTIKIWDLAMDAPSRTLESHYNVTSVVLSKDCEMLASSSNRSIKIWSVSTGNCTQTIEGCTGWGVPAFSPDSSRIATSMNNFSAKIWEVATGKLLHTIKGLSRPVAAFCFSADNERLVIAQTNSTIKLWDATGTRFPTIQADRRRLSSVAFSNDGQSFASGFVDATVKIWEIASGNCLHTLRGHSESVTAVTFSASGHHLASGCLNGAIKVWSCVAGDCLQTLSMGKPVTSLSFDPLVNARLHTDLGAVTLDLSSSTEISARQLRLSGWGISADGAWIMKDGENMLWLPPDFRSKKRMCNAVQGSVIGIGCPSDRVIIMRFAYETLL